MTKRIPQQIMVRDYGDEWVNRLAVVCNQFDKMELAEQIATLRYVLHKYGNASEAIAKAEGK
jgi:hypothetical protein